MVAFTEDKNKTVLTGLEQAAGDQTSPSGPTGPAASQGALGAPANAGAKPDNAFVGYGELGADEGGGQRYIDMWDDPATSDEDRVATVDELERSLGAGGSGVIAKTNETVSKIMKEGDMPGLGLLLDWGWTPDVERPEGDSAFGGKKNLGSEFTEQAGDMGALGADIVPGEAPKPEGKPKWDRKRMGGFLMEFGLRMLASDRDDAGEAFGEAALGTMEARDQRKKTAAAEELAKQERDRKQRREDEGDLHKREKEKRDARAAELREKDEARKVEDQAKKGLVRVKQDDGSFIYASIKKGRLVDEEGNTVYGETDKVSLAQQHTNARADVNTRKDIRKALIKALTGSIRKHPQREDLQKIKDEEDPAKRERLMEVYEDKEYDRAKGKKTKDSDNPMGLERP